MIIEYDPWWSTWSLLPFHYLHLGFSIKRLANALLSLVAFWLPSITFKKVSNEKKSTSRVRSLNRLRKKIDIEKKENKNKIFKIKILTSKTNMVPYGDEVDVKMNFSSKAIATYREQMHQAHANARGRRCAVLEDDIKIFLKQRRPSFHRRTHHKSTQAEDESWNDQEVCRIILANIRGRRGSIASSILSWTERRYQLSVSYLLFCNFYSNDTLFVECS